MRRLRIVPVKQDTALGIHATKSKARETRARTSPAVAMRVNRAKISNAEAVMARPKIRPGMRTVVARSVVMAVAAILVTQASAVTAKKTMVDRSMLRIVKNVIVRGEVVKL